MNVSELDQIIKQIFFRSQKKITKSCKLRNLENSIRIMI
jgi:hypothetical protein